MNRALFSAVTLAIAVSGCDGHLPRVLGGGPTPTKKCNGSSTKCELTVTVTGCAADGSGIRLDHWVLGVESGNHDVDIKWKLEGNDYEFPENAIKFKNGGGGQFDQPSGNKNNYKWRDKNESGSGYHDYSVTVVKKGGAPCATKDPTIVNDA